jgi:hypothetical protein
VGNAHLSSIMEVILTCHVCGSNGDNGIVSYSKFNIAGYQSPCVDWSDYQDKIPPDNECKWWMRSDKTPKFGERRIVYVKHPFRETDEKDFWTFYQPAHTSVNGMDECMEEIDSSAFVKCKLLKILSLEGNQAWLQVLVTEVILLKDAQDLIPLQYEKSSFLKNEKPSFLKKLCGFKTYEESSFLKKLCCYNPYYYRVYGRWEYYFGGLEGDMGNWFVIYKNDLDVRLISFGEWMFHQESAYLGNLVISEETYQRLTEDRKSL